MKKFLVLGLEEPTVITEALLGSEGIYTESRYYIIGRHIGTFEDINEAELIATESAKDYEHGCEIKTIFTNK